MGAWIATRKTAQGSIIHLWDDGAITWAMGRYIDGSSHARTPEQIALARAAGWLVLGDVELYDDSEVPALIAAARWVAARGGEPGDVRDRLHRPTALRPQWTVIEADRDGNPRVRCWKLPRLRWPGLSVWSDGGRYSLWREMARTGTYSRTGIEFTNLADLSRHLLSEARQ